MKKTALSIILIAISALSFCQLDSLKKNLFLGGSFGLNRSNILVQDLTLGIEVINKMGIYIAASYGYKLSPKIWVIANSGMSFSNNNLFYTNSNGALSKSSLLSVTFDFGFRTLYRFANTTEKSPYLSFGASTAVPYFMPFPNATAKDRINLALDIGAGYDISLEEISVAGEIRYSFGLRNVAKNTDLGAVNFHTVKLLFNIRGND